MNIPDEAVEAAAELIAYRLSQIYPGERNPQHEARVLTRIILESAAQLITAAAWDDGYAHGYKHGKADCMKLHEGLGGLHRKQGEEMNIPDEAVEAAARAMAPAVWGPQVWTFVAHGETPTAARARVQRQALEDARKALEAAAPHLMASRQSIADVLAAHQLHSGERGMNRRCKCGWLGQVFGNDFEKDFITHQADMLTVAQRKGLNQ